MLRFCCLLFCLLLPLSVAAEAPRVVFDQGHRQGFVIEKDGPLQLSELANLLQQQGWQVTSSNQPLAAETLRGIDALIISGPFQSFSAQEINSAVNFIEQGGSVAIMVHIGQTLLPLVHRLGVDVGNLVIQSPSNQLGDQPINFYVDTFKPHRLTDNLNQFAIYGGWPLRSFAPPGEVIASSSQHAWVDIDHNQQLSTPDQMNAFAVVVAGELGKGRFAIFADDAIFQNKFLTEGNRTLADNLGHWLRGNAASQREI